jgi:hypothetical protein
MLRAQKLFNLFVCSGTLAGLLTACAPMRYSEYIGHDASSLFGTWPTGSGTMAEKGSAIPVFRGWPDKPYVVLGSLRLSNPDQTWDEGDFASAARRARRKGADAIIIRYGSEFGVSKIAGAKNEPLVRSSRDTSALAIRWLTPAEIAEQRAKLDRLKSLFPDLKINNDLKEVLFSYLVRSGRGDSASNADERARQTLLKLHANDPQKLDGYWFYKIVLSTGSSISGEEEHDFLGLANLTQTGDSLAIVSREGNVELSLSGEMRNNRVTGQLGIGPYSSKCEGVVTPDKISISFQSRNSDGLVRGNMVLQRLLDPVI